MCNTISHVVVESQHNKFPVLATRRKHADRFNRLNTKMFERTILVCRLLTCYVLSFHDKLKTGYIVMMMMMIMMIMIMILIIIIIIIIIIIVVVTVNRVKNSEYVRFLIGAIFKDREQRGVIMVKIRFFFLFFFVCYFCFVCVFCFVLFFVCLFVCCYFLIVCCCFVCNSLHL